MIHFLQYLGGFFMGWGLGANDSANVFGTAVSSHMVKFRLAVILTAFFVIAGAILQGEAGIRTISNEIHGGISSREGSPADVQKLRARAVKSAVVVSFSAAAAVIILTFLKMPVSTSQAVVGAIAGIGILRGSADFASLSKFAVCWIGTPLGAAILTILFFHLSRYFFRRYRTSVFVYDPIMTFLLIVCGCYGAYALGANNVANVAAVFVGEDMLTARQAAVLGGFCIAAGALTYAKPVMTTVGSSIVKLDAFSAFICVFSHAVTVHIYAMIGVPVSTTQAIIGAVLGIGLIKGGHTINLKSLLHVLYGWFAAPAAAAMLSAFIYFLSSLHYSS